MTRVLLLKGPSLVSRATHMWRLVMGFISMNAELACAVPPNVAGISGTVAMTGAIPLVSLCRNFAWPNSFKSLGVHHSDLLPEGFLRQNATGVPADEMNDAVARHAMTIRRS